MIMRKKMGKMNRMEGRGENDKFPHDLHVNVFHQNIYIDFDIIALSSNDLNDIAIFFLPPVFQSLCNRIIERPADLFSPKTIVTLFQYVAFFTQENRRNPEKCINDLTNECELKMLTLFI